MKRLVLAAALGLLFGLPASAQTVTRCLNGALVSTGCYNYGAVLVNPDGSPATISSGGGGGSSGGGAVYGTDATGVSPTKAPLFIAGVDGNGKIVPFTITANGLQFFANSLPLPTGAATDTSVQAVKTTLGTPFQAGGSIGNTAFGISGSLPAFAATPTFKIDQTTPGTTNKVSIGTDGTVASIPAPGTCADTPKALNSTSTTLLPAGTYKSVNYMNIGTNPMTFVEGTGAAVVGNGMALSGASAAGLQGGSYAYSTPPTNAVQAISASGTTVIVKVCN